MRYQVTNAGKNTHASSWLKMNYVRFNPWPVLTDKDGHVRPRNDRKLQRQDHDQKELIRDVLLTKYHVHATLGNLNNHIGVPLTLLNAPPNPEMVVVEMGANHQGEIALLSSIAEPTHGYITNIGLAHLDGFGGEHGVYLGKELFDYLAKSRGTAFVQSSDAKVEQAASIVLDQVDVGPKLELVHS